MRIQNAEVAALFNQLADLLEIEGDNPFRVRAYRNAALLINGLSHDVADLVAEGKDLTELPGIGDALAEKITTIVKTGELPALKAVQKRLPAGLSQLMQIQGLGPKRVQALFKDVHVKSIKDLNRALASGAILSHEGFGGKSVAQIKKAVEQFKPDEQRTKLADADKVATALVTSIKAFPGVKKIIVAGSFRRQRITVGDLDILVTAQNGAAVIEKFVKLEEVRDVVSKGTTRSTVHLKSGLQIDIRVVPEVSYGAALLYFTGSKAHNIKLRKLAVNKKLKINEYGVFKGKKRIAGKTEKEIYQLLKLPYFEPELREDRGEIELAQKSKLPKLVTLKNIRGDLHSHTKATDGINTLEEMAAAASEKGYQYLAITDHSKHLTVAHGLDKKRLAQAIKAIDKLNAKLKGITVLKSIEMDILEDGTLDLPDSILKELDLTVCSVHYKFNLSAKKQTERIIRAMDNPYFNILAHPTGRLIYKREAYAINLEKIMQAAYERGCILEVNAQPERMDLDDVHCRMAKEHKVKVAISTDAHSIANLDYMKFGVGQARRGWLTAKDVVNTYTLAQLRQVLRRH